MTLKYILVALIALVVIGVIVYFLWRRKTYGKHIYKLPLFDLGYKDMPAVPFQLEEIPKTLVQLGLRTTATTQAKWGMSNEYTIGDYTANGYSFLYGRGSNAESTNEQNRLNLKAALETSNPLAELNLSNLKNRMNTHSHSEAKSNEDPITDLFLTDPRQFTLSWTTFNDVYKNAQPQLADMAGALTDVATANRTFWPTIANYGFAYNLLVLEKVDATRAIDYKAALGAAWTAEIEELFNNKLLYAIDLRMYESLPVSQVKGHPRYTPATLTLLAQNPTDKSLSPIVVLLIDPNNKNNVIYSYGSCTDGAWIFALTAARTSVTLYGIWMGHVYHWHIVSAALIMTLNNHVEEDHPLRKFMDPQSDYVIPFDNTLLLLWKQIAPPTSVATSLQYLNMTNDFAKGRTYLKDDPNTTLADNGIKPDDFSHGGDWAQFPIAGQLLSIFDAAGDYVSVFVNKTWTSDAEVVEDKQLQAWYAASVDPHDGNVAGIPTLDSRDNLIKTLQSWVFRLTAHGASRLNSTANPVLSFIPNLPPCLQKTEIPSPTEDFSTDKLLTYLPNTGTIGEMITFLFTFVFSAPYVPFIPLSGDDTELIWGNDPNEPRNKALIAYRQFLADFIRKYESPEPGQIHQWPRNIET